MLLLATSGVAQPVTAVSGGDWHTLFLKADGSLWGMGDEYSGELGNGTYGTDPYYATNRPIRIVGSNVTAIAAGNGDTLFLKSDGSLWAMGDEYEGQLGDGTYGTPPNYAVDVPEQIVASNVTAIAVEETVSFFIKSDGSLWAMGDNSSGSLGDGTYNNTNRPELIIGSDVTSVSVGGGHTLVLKNDGSLWACGHNGNGELGDGTTTDTTRFKEIVASNVTAIAAGGYTSLFLKIDGGLWGMGNNYEGELGDGTFNSTNSPKLIVASNVMAISVGWLHCLFLKTDGSLWAMGDNSEGELGDGTYNNANRPERIVAGGVTAIFATGQNRSLFLKNDGSLWGMGDNSSGSLGDGIFNGVTNRPTQILGAYNQISGQLLASGSMQLSFVGVGGANYALDRSSSLSPAGWVSQVTNVASSYGSLVFTNDIDANTNNFWRIRPVR